MTVADSNDIAALLDRAFQPRAIALYGATARPGAMGTQFAERLLGSGFGGRFVPVSTRRQDVFGVESVLSASEAATPIDHALIVVPAEAVAGAVRDAGAAGVGIATILAAGFSEVGDAGADLDREVREAARDAGVRLMGPNCLGFVSFRDDIAASTLNFDARLAGGVSVVGQSGSICARLANGLLGAGIGLDLVATIGNSIDLGPADLIAYFASRDSTRVVVAYIENIGDPAAMAAAIRTARAAGKEVVVLKSGRTEAGARSAASHTGATASNDLFVDLLLRDSGAIRAETVGEAVDVAGLLSRIGRLRGKAAIVAPSGGDCTLAADRCSTLGIPLATISDEGQAAMRAAVPICAPSNPIDPTTMAFHSGQLGTLFDIVAEEEDVDYFVFLTSTTLVRPIARDLVVDTLKSVHDRGVPVIVGAPVAPEVRERLREIGIGLVEDSEWVFDCIRTILDPGDAPPRAAEERAPAAPPKLMGELDALATLRDAGLPMLATETVADLGALRAALDRIGYPVVLKGLVPDTGHKSGLGLVKLDIQSLEQAEAAFADLDARLADFAGSAIIVQQAVKGALAELLVGVVSDPVFGKHVTLGMGGVFTDFHKDRVWMRAPVDRARAGEMLDRLPIGPGIRGGRKGVRGDADGLVDAIVRLSEWAVENDAWVEEVEINPVMVRRDDVLGVDALVALRPGSGAEATR